MRSLKSDPQNEIGFDNEKPKKCNSKHRAAFFLIATAISASLSSQASAESKVAIFAGGCFWCIEKDFEHVKGVIDAQSGYTGGTTANPNYKNYEAGGHIEALKIVYDPQIVTYEKLLHAFWRSVNPTDGGGQFCDRGYGYTTAVFALDDMQFIAAEESKKAIDEAKLLTKPIVTPVIKASAFWPAEDYHQNYYKKAPLRYAYYRRACGRDKTVKALWGEEAYAGINY